VAGDVDKGEVGAVDDLMREAEIDGDAARFLFLQPIGIGAGEREHERAFAVVDVACCADDYGFHDMADGSVALRNG
jgi:hypothetical protein